MISLWDVLNWGGRVRKDKDKRRLRDAEKASPVMWNKVGQLFLVNILSCGLEICLSTGTIYIPPLLLETGMEERFMTMVLGLGPVMGLVFLPMIGSASDHWSGRFGRRRPFIWGLGAGVLLSLWLIPQASSLAALVSSRHGCLEVLLLVAGICLIEFCGHACFTPLEALLSDLFPSEEESRQAFSMYALMVSLGGCVGYLLPAVDWNGGHLAEYAGGQEAFIYTLLTLIFLLCMLSTAFISEERCVEAPKKRLASAGAPAASIMCCARSSPSHSKHLRLAMAGCLSALPRLYHAYRQVPAVICRLFLAEVCSWMALMTFLLFYTDFVGEGLYKGVPTADPGSIERLRYDEGIRMGSLGLFLHCSTSVVFSLLMDRLVRSVGRRAVYLSSIGVLALATLVMSLSRSLPLITLMAAATGFTFSTLQILPYTLTCLYHADMPAFFPSSTSQMSEELGMAEMTMMVPTGGIKQHYSNGHSGGMSGSGSPSSGLAAAPSLSMFVSLPLDVPPASSRGSPPDAPRGMGLDLAILDSAYLLSQLLPSLLLGYLVQVTGSVSTYMVCASAFSLLAIYTSSKIIFDRADLERSGIDQSKPQAGVGRGSFLDERT